MTKAETQTMYHLENDNINIQYVQLPFDIIADSLIKISDLEVKNYIKENKKKFKRDASRNIQYVVFRENPTEEDLSKIRLRLDGLKEERISYNDVSKLTDTLEGFKKTNKITDFVDQYSEVSFDSIYKARGELNNEYADILFKLTPGEVFGPYKDGEEKLYGSFYT
jgi:parvulin-like peptidyl-prolyl isomerase